MNEREIFIEALQKEDAAERRAFLDHACAADVPLRARVEGLLQVNARAGSFLERPAVAPAGTDVILPTPEDGPTAGNPPADPEGPGTVVGPYRLLGPLGEG